MTSLLETVDQFTLHSGILNVGTSVLISSGLLLLEREYILAAVLNEKLPLSRGLGISDHVLVDKVVCGIFKTWPNSMITLVGGNLGYNQCACNLIFVS